MIAYQPARTWPDLSWLRPQAELPCIVQRGRTLGAKIVHAFEQAFRAGARKTVVVGSDTPHLGPVAIRQAFRLLDTRDVVLGPATDGGYFLVGLSRPVPDLFAGISWSTAHVLRQTLDRVKDCGLSYALLGQCRDIDTFADLQDLLLPSYAGQRSGLRFTLQALEHMAIQKLY